MAVIQHRRGTSAELAQQTPAAGEIFFETDTNRIKIGDGQTAYGDLAYLDNDIAISDVIDLAAQLAGKAALYHQHDIDDVGGLQEILDGKASLEHSQDIHNLERAGAIDGQVITWSDALGKWVPQGQAIAAGSFVGGTVTSSIQGPDGSASTAAYGFTADAGTGMHRGSDGSLRLTNGSVIGLSIDAAGGVSVPQGLAISSLKPPSGSTATNYFVSYDGNFYAIPSSGAYREYGQQVLDDDVNALSSIAISDDGLRMVVGLPATSSTGTTGPGKIKIYDFDEASGTWVLSQAIDGTTFAVPVAAGGFTGEGLGAKVAISGDGTVIAAAASNSTGGYYSGSKPIRIYERQNTGVWQERSNHPDQIHRNCYAFALSKDGNRIAYNWLSDEPNGLESWKVQAWSGTAWLDDGVGADLLSNVQALSYSTVALSHDGLTVAIGRQDESYTPSGGGGQVGVIRVFSKSGTTWSQVGSNITGDGSLGGLGKGVSVQSSGSDIIVASIEDNYYYYGRSGAVVIHHWDGAAWSQANRFIPHLTYGITGGFLSHTVISSDGLQVAAFDPYWDNFGVDNMGLVAIFKTDSVSSPSYYLYRSLLSSSSAANTAASETRMSGFAITSDFDRTAEISYDLNVSSYQPAVGLFTSRFVPGPTVTLNSLTDVSEATPSQGNALVWNATSSQWEPGEVDSLQSSFPAGPYTPGTVVAEIDRKLNSDAAWTATDSTAFVAFHPSGSQTFAVGPRVNGGDPSPTSVIDLDYGATPNSGSYWRITGSASAFSLVDSSVGSVITVDPSGPTTTFGGEIVAAGNVFSEVTTGDCKMRVRTSDSATGTGSFLIVSHTPSTALAVDDAIGHLVYQAVKSDGTPENSVAIRAYVDGLATTTGCPARIETLQADDQGVTRFSQIVFSNYRRFDQIIGNVGGGWGNSGLFPSYGCRAFAKVQQSGVSDPAQMVVGAALSHPGSGGFSSITQIGQASLQCNFEYAMPDTYYSVVVTGQIHTSNGQLVHGQWGGVMYDAQLPQKNPTTTYFTIAHGHQNSGNFVLQPINYLSIAVFR